MVPLTSENLYSLMPHGSLPSNHPGPSSVMTLWLRERVSSRSMPKNREQPIGESFTFSHTVGGRGAGAKRNLIALLGPLRCIKELNRPAPPPPPPTIHTGHRTEQLRNQQRYVKCIKYASGT
jgi:hypothetical protein